MCTATQSTAAPSISGWPDYTTALDPGLFLAFTAHRPSLFSQLFLFGSFFPHSANGYRPVRWLVGWLVGWLAGWLLKLALHYYPMDGSRGSCGLCGLWPVFVAKLPFCSFSCFVMRLLWGFIHVCPVKYYSGMQRVYGASDSEYTRGCVYAFPCPCGDELRIAKALDCL